MNKLKTTTGFSMIEILISVVIIAIGLLGMAGLQIKSQQAEMGSYQHSQALILMRDMVNRMYNNRAGIECYQKISLMTGSVNYLGAGASINTKLATLGGCGSLATRALADEDLSHWDSVLDGASECLDGSSTCLSGGGNNIGSIQGGRGCITYDATNDIYTVSVAWQGSTDTVTPTNTCGEGNYGGTAGGAELRRRVVSTTVQIADLD